MTGILDSTGVDTDLKFYVRALYDWCQQPDIVTAIVESGRATRVSIADLFLVLHSTKDDIGRIADPAWWEMYEDKIQQTLYAFVINRNVRRLIAKRMSKRGIPVKLALRQLEALRKVLAVELES